MGHEQLRLKNQLCFPLYASAKEVVRQYTPFLEKLNLTYTQYIVMLALWEHQPTNVKTLGEYLYLDSGTLTPLLKKLEQRGLIRRERSGRDERNVLVHLAEAGMGMEAEAADIPLRMRSCLPLTEAEATTLYRLLYKILAAGEP